MKVKQARTERHVTLLGMQPRNEERIEKQISRLWAGLGSITKAHKIIDYDYSGDWKGDYDYNHPITITITVTCLPWKRF